VTDEIERLVTVSRGRAAVLFTSYNVMGRVHAELQKKRLPYPMWKLERGTSNAIERFKQSGKGVLLASGSLWEGIDIPGDALSMLIIVKLPFQAPDALSEAERERYAYGRDYLREVLVPDMLIKLRQGAGRLIRTETDTGVIAILGCRANERGAYFLPVTAALPDCDWTSDINDIDPFLRERKPAEYFAEQTGAFPESGKAPQGRIA
jgi:ATP-dependent DNA helicase DinG